MIFAPGRGYTERSGGVQHQLKELLSALDSTLASLELLMRIAEREHVNDGKALTDLWASVSAARRSLLKAPKVPGVKS